MKIEEGRFYSTRDGRKIGPMVYTEGRVEPFSCDGRTWNTNGSYLGGDPCETDLVAIWQDETPSPIQSKIVKTVEPGCYGRIKVTGTYQGNRITLDWEGSERVTNAVPIVGLSSSELRAAALTFTELADFLEEQGK